MDKLKRRGLLFLSLLLVLSLAACSGGQNASFEMDVQEIYEQLTALPDMPEMIVLPEDKALDFLGLDMSKCVQAVTAICAMNIQADEIWLVEKEDGVSHLTSMDDLRLRASEDLERSYLDGRLPGAPRIGDVRP